MAGAFENSIDAVSDRDFALELLSAGTILAVHLSRLAEDLVLWSSQEFGFARPADADATGSSMMPQKRNPDVAELVRGKAGRVLGDLVALATAMKGLPLAYDRDLQEDKEPLFDAHDTLAGALGALAAMVRGLAFDTERMRGRGRRRLPAGDRPGRAPGGERDAVPRRPPPDRADRRRARGDGRTFADVTPDEWAGWSALLGPDVAALLTPEGPSAAHHPGRHVARHRWPGSWPPSRARLGGDPGAGVRDGHLHCAPSMTEARALQHRSRDVVVRPPSRAMLRAVGFSDEDFAKPQVGVASSWNEVTPCNYHLNRLAAAAKEGSREAGGVPIEFTTIAV